MVTGITLCYHDTMTESLWRDTKNADGELHA